MRRPRHGGLGLGFWGALLAATFAGAAPSVARGAEPSARELQQIVTPIDPDEVWRGQRGWGLSVFTGAEIQVFGVEVISAVRNFLPGQDVVLVRCSGWKLEETKVIGGMSGSPVYLEDREGQVRLLGALAYGWSFSLEPIAGITPISAMRRDLARPREQPGEGDSTFALPTDRDLDLAPASGPGAAAAADLFPAAGGDPPRPTALTRLATPLMVSGLSARGVEEMARHLRPLGIEPIQSGGVAGGDDEALQRVRLEPGSAIGVKVAGGDVDLVGVGTCTYVGADGVLAFGHPMFGGGEYDIPMTTAYIHVTVGSVQRSFKFGAPIRDVGLIRGDYQSCIAGSLGESAQVMLPVAIRVRNEKTGYEKRYHVEVIKHRALTRMFLAGIISDVVGAAESTFGPTFATRRLAVRMKDGAQHVFTNCYASSSGFDFSTTDPVTAILFNDYTRADIDRVAVSVEIQNTDPTADLWTLAADRSEIEPGDTVTLTATLRPRRGELFAVRVPVQAPAHFAPGPLEIHLVGGAGMAPESPRVRDLPTLLAALKERDAWRANTVIAVLGRARAELEVEGQRIAGLPATMLHGMVSPTDSRGGEAAWSAYHSAPVSIGSYLMRGGGRVVVNLKERRRP
ncbi:MAG: hypothetical protein HY719_01765 [Planctomycetes bacterium]|nr:hypothetical protein [Planctomycetota bacterium]